MERPRFNLKKFVPTAVAVGLAIGACSNNADTTPSPVVPTPTLKPGMAGCASFEHPDWEMNKRIQFVCMSHDRATRMDVNLKDQGDNSVEVKIRSIEWGIEKGKGPLEIPTFNLAHGKTTKALNPLQPECNVTIDNKGIKPSVEQKCN